MAARASSAVAADEGDARPRAEDGRGHDRHGRDQDDAVAQGEREVGARGEVAHRHEARTHRRGAAATTLRARASSRRRAGEERSRQRAREQEHRRDGRGEACEGGRAHDGPRGADRLQEASESSRRARSTGSGGAGTSGAMSGRSSGAIWGRVPTKPSRRRQRRPRSGPPRGRGQPRAQARGCGSLRRRAAGREQHVERTAATATRLVIFAKDDETRRATSRMAAGGAGTLLPPASGRGRVRPRRPVPEASGVMVALGKMSAGVATSRRLTTAIGARRHAASATGDGR